MREQSFLNWVNLRLSEQKKKINSIDELSDGLSLVILIEVLSKKSIPNYNKNPKMIIHFTNNFAQVLERIKQEGIRLENIGPKGNF